MQNKKKLMVSELKPMSTQSLGEEIANSITHGIGAALSVAGLVLLVVFASLYGDAWRIVSFSIYGTTLILLYIASTLYHGLTNPKAKRFFHYVDHSAIFLLIAGTYTPITLVPLRGILGWALFGLIWALAIGGIIFKAVSRGRFRIVSVIIYLAMGWLVVIAIKPIIAAVPSGLMLWLVIGGLFYSFGIIFYALKKMPFHHMVWHLFVLCGSISHFLGIFIFLSRK